MKISADRMAQALREPLPRAWLIGGDEPLGVNEAAQRVRERAYKEGFTTRELHVAERGFDWLSLSASAQTGSLFAERRLIELRLPTPRPGDAGAQVLADLLKADDPDRLLLVLAPKIDATVARTAWVKAFEQHGVRVEVWPVEAAALPGWIRQRMQAVGFAPDSDAVQLLAERCEGNLLAAQQEIDKLRLLYDAGALTAEQVLASASDSTRFDAFKLADAALDGAAARALKILDGLRAEGVEPVLVSWSLAREVRVLLGLRRRVAAGESLDRAVEAARMWPRRRPLVKKALQRLSLERLTELLALAAHADACIKGAAAGHPWMLLTELVLGLCRPQAPLPQLQLARRAAVTAA